MDKKLRETTNLFVEIMNSEMTSKGETWSHGKNSRTTWRKRYTQPLYYLTCQINECSNWCRNGILMRLQINAKFNDV